MSVPLCTQLNAGLLQAYVLATEFRVEGLGFRVKTR